VKQGNVVRAKKWRDEMRCPHCGEEIKRPTIEWNPEPCKEVEDEIAKAFGGNYVGTYTVRLSLADSKWKVTGKSAGGDVASDTWEGARRLEKTPPRDLSNEEQDRVLTALKACGFRTADD
jgi:hypothetical protein